ncbi:MAG TPA: GNAT family N-acetyltransferase, partial [Myxococcota bacterium]
MNATVIDARLASQRTARLTLRVPEERDLDAWAGWLGDDDTVRFLGGTISTRAQSWRTLAMVIGHWHLRGYGSWTACDVNDDDVVVGRGGLWRP